MSKSRRRKSLQANIKERFGSIKKPKHRVAHVFKRIRNKIEDNRVLSSSYFTRIVILCFFLGLNIILIPNFLKSNSIKIPEKISQILLNDPELITQDFKYEEPSLDPQVIFEKLNNERELRDKEPFEYNDKLASVAAELLLEAEKYEYELGGSSFTEEFKAALDKSGYNYAHVHHNMVVGPLVEDAVVSSWFSSDQQVTALFDDDFEDVGFATKVVKTKYNETLGVTVQVLGIEQKTSGLQTQPQTSKTSVFTFPVISNEEVFEALNNYRESHNVFRLSENEHLCKYAEKRLQDLVALGTLDGHEGFKKDFADPNNLPQPIQDFNGARVAENLAYQHCKNMTTGENFIAESGAAIIEWCFDSSTSGHREAQLSRDYGQACVRNGNGFFVIIFGGD